LAREIPFLNMGYPTCSSVNRNFITQTRALSDESRVLQNQKLIVGLRCLARHHFLLKTSGRLLVTQPRRQFVSRVHAVRGAVDRR
jgi:hypothetical protein